MKTKVQANRIDIKFYPETATLKVFLNHNPRALIFEGASADLYRIIEKSLIIEKDFDSYLTFWNLKKDNLLNWFIDFIKHYEDKSIFNMWARVYMKNVN